MTYSDAGTTSNPNIVQFTGVLKSWALKGMQSKGTSIIKEQLYTCPSDGYISAACTGRSGYNTTPRERDDLFVNLANSNGGLKRHIFYYVSDSTSGSKGQTGFVPVKKGNCIAVGVQNAGEHLPPWMSVAFIPVKYRDLNQQ